MNNIDILEEFIVAYREAEEVLDGEIIEAIETLIAENKELKEMLKHRIEYTNKLEKDLFQNASNYVIPKSKLKAKIEEVEQWGLYNMKIPKLSTLDERLGAKIGIKYVLQSLLGKEINK